ncbi:MAG: 2Fe-2S iron-sulfur cluster-binding protein, partial [Bacteroidales bacterium]
MITFTLNSNKTTYTGELEKNLLEFLRKEKFLTAAKDGCSGQGVCGACSVEVDGKIKMACRIKMKNLEGAVINTLEGLSGKFKSVLGKNFAQKGAVQCGFCSPGMIMRAKGLYNANPTPTRNDIIRAVSPNLCRCTGYVKIIDAIEISFKELQGERIEEYKPTAKVGDRYPKYQAAETALGERDFVDDMHIDGMLFGALKFSDHPKAKVLSIDTADALKVDGVVRIITAKDIPGNHISGLIFQDWPLMIGIGETTHYIGDVIAGVIATTEEIARKAVNLIEIDYEVYRPIT